VRFRYRDIHALRLANPRQCADHQGFYRVAAERQQPREWNIEAEADRVTLDRWIVQWSDLVDFDVVPVLTSRAFWATSVGRRLLAMNDLGTPRILESVTGNPGLKHNEQLLTGKCSGSCRRHHAAVYAPQPCDD
jgi:hypothetical protein